MSKLEKDEYATQVIIDKFEGEVSMRGDESRTWTCQTFALTNKGRCFQKYGTPFSDEVWAECPMP